MKLSELERANMLKKELENWRQAKDTVSGFPRDTGYLHLGRSVLILPHETVDSILSEMYDRLMAVAQELDLEIDE